MSSGLSSRSICARRIGGRHEIACRKAAFRLSIFITTIDYAADY